MNVTSISVGGQSYSVTVGQDGSGQPVVDENSIKSAIPGITSGELSQVAADLAKVGIKFSTGDGKAAVPGVCNANGAPEIDGVVLQFSPEDLAAALQVLTNKGKEAQLGTAKQDLDAKRTQMDASHKEAQAKIEEWKSKCVEAAEQKKTQSVLGWVMAGVGLLAAAIGVVVAAAAIVVACLTAGAAAPIAAAVIGGVVACIGLVAGGIALGSQISVANGGEPIELSHLTEKLCTKILLPAIEADIRANNPGITDEEVKAKAEEKAGNAGKALSGALIVASLVVSPALAAGLMLLDPALVGNSVAGIVGLCGADKDTVGWVAMGVTLATTIVMAVAVTVVTCGLGAGALFSSGAKVAVDTAKTGVQVGANVAEASVYIATETAKESAKAVIKMIAKIIQIVGSIMQGTASIGAGSVGIAKGGVGVAEAITRREGDQAQIDKKKVDAIIVALMKAMEEDQEEIKKIMKQMEEGIQAVSQMIAGGAETRSQIAVNLGVRATV